MHIGLVSTWLQHCGLASYCENLAAAIRDAGHQVSILAELPDDGIRDDAQVDLDGIAVYRCWNRHDGNVSPLVTQAKALRLDAVHVQHEFGLWPNRSGMIKALQGLSHAAPLFVTPHTITGRSFPGVTALAWFYPQLQSSKARLVVHTRGGWNCLATDHRYPAARMRLIPHGSPDPDACEKTPQLLARSLLDLPLDRFVAVSLGFIGSGKRQDVVLTAVHDLVHDGDLRPEDIYYVIVGKPGGGWANSGPYVQAMKDALATYRMHDYAEIRTEFVPFDELPHWYGAADCIINASCPTQYSATGRCRLPAAYGCPQIIEDVEIHKDLIEAGAVSSWSYGDLAGLQRSILSLQQDVALRRRLARAGQRYARETTWKKTAEEHLRWYEEGMR